jgi:hypothetical protein
MLSEVMERAAALAAQGKGAEDIAAELKLSVFWVNMVMKTDAFTYLRGKYETVQDAEAGDGTESAEAEGRGEAEDNEA